MCKNRSAFFFLLICLGGILAEAEPRRTAEEVQKAIFRLKVTSNKAEKSAESDSTERLNTALDRLLADFNRFSKESKLTTLPFEKLWIKMNSVEGRSVVYPELLVRLLVMSDEETLAAAEKLRLIEKIPASTRGCCAVEAYYKFDHERVIDMPDAVILALATHVRIARTKEEKGFHHGMMIELVDRGYRDSYNGYACAQNKTRGCRISAVTTE